MPIGPGSKIGSYQVVSVIGAGGMGEVYRASDTKLGREVALKILSPAFVLDPDRVARFNREAKILAALNHPNIATLYGVEERGPDVALVMELVEGETLAEVIAQSGTRSAASASQGLKALGVDEARRIALQIADALDAAHERGIVHRDLKPSNVKISSTGLVKVLDFGLAKAVVDGEKGDLANSPTLTLSGTRQGVILGTAAYMSPEQARGLAIDKRSDIWAFGCVLYEMLTGRPAFEGTTVADVIAAIIHREPDWTTLPVATPPGLSRLVRRCLQKEPKDRLRDIGDARLELAESFPHAATLTVPSAGQIDRTRVALWMSASIGSAILAVFSSVGWWRASQAGDAQRRLPMHLNLDLGPTVSLGSSMGADIILSPDGHRLAFVSGDRLFTRRLDQLNATMLAGTEGAFAPFFSPDGQWVAFFSAGKLRKIPIDGGGVITLCDAPNGRGGSWGTDGNIIAALSGVGPLVRLPSSGGVPEPLSTLAAGEITHRWPDTLPGSRAVLFTAHNAPSPFDQAHIDVLSLADRQKKTVVRGATFGRYVPGRDGAGYLTYVGGGRLLAVPFDPNSLQVRGAAFPLLDEVFYHRSFGFGRFHFSQSGSLVYRMPLQSTVQWLSDDGSSRPILGTPGKYSGVALSPDGTRLAVSLGEDGVSVFDWRRGIWERLDRQAAAAVWAPDAQYLILAGPDGMSWTRADGTSRPQPLTRSANLQIPTSFAPDGQRLAYSEMAAEAGEFWNLWTASFERDHAGLKIGKPEPFLATSSDERGIVFSPDGRWVAYESNESGTSETYVRAFPQGGGKWQVSNGGGVQPQWARSRPELFFRGADNRIRVARYIVKAGTFMSETPRVWSDLQIADTGRYSVAPDDKRIVAVVPVKTSQTERENQAVLMLNAVDELRRRASPVR